MIADDHLHFRRVGALLQSEPDFELAGEACDGDEAIGLAAVLQPEVVLMDLPQCPGPGASKPPVASSTPAPTSASSW